MSVQHTPGPWTVEPCTPKEDGSHFEGFMVWALADCEHHPIADCSCNHTCRMDWDVEANARLIAAAPDMLAALHEAREYLDGYIDVVDGSYGIPEPNREMMLCAEIDAAIAKAEGVSPISDLEAAGEGTLK